VITLRRCVTYRGEQVATVVSPDGTLRNMPAWMIEPAAAQLDLHEPPRLSQQCLTDLRHVLDVALSLLDRATIASTDSDAGAA
jgi:hypothetical protein